MNVGKEGWHNLTDNEDEKNIITQAIQILKDKGCYDSKRIN